MADRKKTARKASAKNAKKKRAAQRKQVSLEALGYVLIVLGIFLFVSVVVGGAGLLGKGLAGVIFGLFGLGAYVVPVLVACIGWILLVAGRMNLQVGKLVLTALTVLMIFAVNHLFSDAKIQALQFEHGLNAGYPGYIHASYLFGKLHHIGSGAVGGLVTYPMQALLGNIGCWILTIALMIGCVFVLGKLSMRRTAQKVNDAAISTGRKVRSNVHSYTEQRAQLRQERRQGAGIPFDPEYSKHTESLDSFPRDHVELQKTEVSVPVEPALGVPVTPLEHSHETLEVGEIYEAPRRRLQRIEVTAHGVPYEADEIELDHIAPRENAEPIEYVPIEVVQDESSRTHTPITVEPVKTEAPMTFQPADPPISPAKPIHLPVQPAIKNPSIRDFDDNPDEPAPRIVQEISPAAEVEYKYEAQNVSEHSTAAPLTPYRFPPMNLLSPGKEIDSSRDKAEEEETQQRVALLEETLSSFGIEARVIHVARGPAITRYELQPARGVKVSRITGLADDIALNMAAAGGVRIEAPIPGKSAVGIEIANAQISTVTLREVLESREFQTHPSKLAVALGKDIAGTPVVADLARMPHLLIAGATGSGKSVCINSIIASILYKATPDEVKLILIDPKVVELSVYNGIPHLLIPVVTDPKKAAGALGWAVQEMTDRYKKFEGAAVRDLKGYNRWAAQNGQSTLPQIVVIVDELADLMMVAQNDVETKICRLTQLARAAGIHLVIATQRPSVDVITGLIKANVPSRIAFAVASQVDSRTILGIGGAEKLLGRGDMLFDPSGASKGIRVQGAYIDDEEVTDLVDFVRRKREVSYDESILKALEQIDTGEGKKSREEEKPEEDGDPLLMDCIELAVDAGQISASMIQRKYRVGYARAGRILDQMEQRGCISGFEGSKPRQTLLTREQFYQMVGAEPDTLDLNDDE